MRLRTLVHPRRATLGITGIVLIAFGVSLLDGVFRWDRYEAKAALGYLQVRWALGLLAAACLGVLVHRIRRAPRPVMAEIGSWLPVRTAIYIVFLAIAITTIADVGGLLGDVSFRLRRFFENALLAGLGLWILAVLGLPRVFAKAPKGPWRVLDLALWNLVLAALLLEGSLSLWARHSESPLFWNTGAIRANIERFRPEPGSRHFGFTFNSAGYYDKEFFRAEDGDLVVAVLADSFGIGVVPYDFNFATVAERRLRETLGDRRTRVAVHNFGIPAIGVPEYLYLLDTEVMDTNPALVVLLAFVGNDIEGAEPKARRLRASFGNWWIWTVGMRVWAVWGPSRHAAGVATIGTASQSGDPVPGFVTDPSQETPTFTEEKFLAIEGKRLAVLDRADQDMQGRYRAFLQALGLLKARLEDRFLLVLIPDEFQVNDSLYDQLLAKTDRPDRYQRDLPQRVIGAYAQGSGIPFLDLLPALREAEQDARTYHLRDTHWNARGNRVAGEAIADFILRHVD